jgi:hypothetical protein
MKSLFALTLSTLILAYANFEKSMGDIWAGVIMENSGIKIIPF